MKKIAAPCMSMHGHACSNPRRIIFSGGARGIFFLGVSQNTYRLTCKLGRFDRFKAKNFVEFYKISINFLEKQRKYRI